MAYKRKRKCGRCQLYIPSDKLPFKTYKIMCPQYDGWCKHYKEERDADEIICNHFVQKAWGKGK